MKPILFNTEMVKAILEGRKTVTRRIACIKPDITCNDGTTDHDFVLDNFTGGKATGFVCRKCGFGVAPPHLRGIPCGTSFFRPRYWPGDILYVRETWKCQEAGYPPRYCVIRYKAGGDVKFEGIHALPTQKGEWKPSIHMPQKIARIFIQIRSVRLEQLHSITADDAMNEGFTDWNQFVSLWNSTINSDDLPIYGWDANPLVWVYEFERCEKPTEE